MPEMNLHNGLPELPPVPTLPGGKFDYYANGKRVRDFFLGIAYSLLFMVVFTYVGNTISSSYGYSFGPYVLLAFLALLTVLCVHYFIEGRRYLAIGIISFFVIPILAVGGCYMVVGGM